MKQETLEEVAKIICHTHKTPLEQANEIVNLLEERSYSEKDMKSAFKVGFSIGYERDVHAINENNRICKEWFEQFKKK